MPADEKGNMGWNDIVHVKNSIGRVRQTSLGLFVILSENLELLKEFNSSMQSFIDAYEKMPKEIT